MPGKMGTVLRVLRNSADQFRIHHGRKPRSLVLTLHIASALLFLGSLSGQAQTTVDQWTWMGGSSVVNLAGVYGTQGTAAATNIPGSRVSSVSWTDSSGNLWLFGGYGYDANGNTGWLNDLWEYNPTTNEWAWKGGSNAVPAGCTANAQNCGQPGAYGTQGTAATTNIPGSRYSSVGWVDSSGHFWLFGGEGMDENGNVSHLNDLWEYYPTTNQWAWINGSSYIGSSYGQPGVYGSLGTPAAGNTPGGRFSSVGWVDSSGHLWLFGGEGGDANDHVAWLNDLWEYYPTTNEWAWMSGSSTAPSVGYGQGGVYGTLGTPAAGNTPGGRYGSNAWIDSSGNLWLFGGLGVYIYNSNADGFGYLNDLWEYSPTTNEWAWMNGSDTASLAGVYGTEGTPATTNTPVGRQFSVAWTDRAGNFWLLGGSSNSFATLNDLWEFNPATNEWAWMSGSSTFPATSQGYLGVYGTEGTAGAQNVPGSRSEAIGWTDINGNLWLFGGAGYGASGSEGDLNDLWKYAPSSAKSTPPSGDFSVAASPTTVTVTAGQSGTTSVTVTPQGGFNSEVSFSCSGLPTGATCSFSPATVTPSGAAVSTTLTVSTATTTAGLRRNPFFPAAMLAAGLCCFGFRKRRGPRGKKLRMLLAMCGFGLALLTGCSGASTGGQSTSTGTGTSSAITVTATSGSLHQTASFTLTVQ
jgi:N-acetylneuraminic acid mutarotase